MGNIIVQSVMLFLTMLSIVLLTMLKQSILMEALHTIALSVQRRLATRPVTTTTKQGSTSKMVFFRPRNF